MSVRKKSIRKGSFLKQVINQRILLLMAIPGVIFMIIFNYIPMYGVVIAFKNYKVTRSIADSPWVGLKHFQDFFNTPDFGQILINTVAISSLKLAIAFPISVIFAVLLNEMYENGFKKFVQTVSYLPHFISWVILGGMMATWMGETGIINDFLLKIHLIDQPIIFLADPDKFWWIALFSDIWKETGRSAIIFLAAISGIDPQLYEAATVDGAGRFMKIWYITLPGIAGTVAIMFILSVSGLLTSNFDQVMNLKNALNVSRSEVIDTYVYNIGIRSGRFSYATAAGLFQSVVSMFLLIISNWVSKKLQGFSLF